MSSTHRTARPARPAKLRRAPADRGVPFRVFIGYGDVPAVRCATAALADAIRSTGRKFDLQPMLWTFAQLASGHWRLRAVRAALEADIVVLASSTPAENPFLETWVEAFLAAKRGRSATLVAVAGSEAWTISIEEAHPTPDEEHGLIPSQPESVLAEPA
ncbi:MAG TPA: hypothetical protein VHE61_16930 [Opitutaceae bacterium]|nr:hypothetical protein [Opitutaceae bacterium]